MHRHIDTEEKRPLKGKKLQNPFSPFSSYIGNCFMSIPYAWTPLDNMDKVCRLAYGWVINIYLLWKKQKQDESIKWGVIKNSYICLLYTSPSPRDRTRSRMPS